MQSLLNKLSAALTAATNGNWEDSPVGQAKANVAVIYAPSAKNSGDDYVEIAEICTNADVQFICLAKNMMPDLLRAVESLETNQHYLEKLSDQGDKGAVSIWAANQLILNNLKRDINAEVPVRFIPVLWDGEGDNDDHRYGIEHMRNDDKVLSVEWFRNASMRDLALKMYLDNDNTKIREEWYDIGDSLTRAFHDYMNGCTFFLVKGTLLWSPICDAKNAGDYSNSVGIPDALPDWYLNFLTTLLADLNFQNNFKEGTFFDVLTDWLLLDNEDMKIFNKNSVVTLTEKGFVFNGLDITNPTLSSCGRLQVDPMSNYGFYLYHTGGGATALQLDTDDNGYIWLTDDEGLSHELPTSVGSKFKMGFYSKDGDEIAVFDLQVAVQV